jgi:hypothetical protein
MPSFKKEEQLAISVLTDMEATHGQSTYAMSLILHDPIKAYSAMEAISSWFMASLDLMAQMAGKDDTNGTDLLRDFALNVATEEDDGRPGVW